MSNERDPANSDEQPKPTKGPGEVEPLLRPARRSRLLARLRNYLVAGIVVTAPIGITMWVLWAFVNFIDEKVLPLLPPEYNPERYLPFSIFLGRLYNRIGERILERMPVVRHIYGALKQVFESILAQKRGAFREVVLVEYPRPGSWVIGFVTSTSTGEIQN